MWHRLTRIRGDFRAWRRTRPFTAGVFGLVAALMVIGPPVMTLRLADFVIAISTIGGVSSLVIGAVLACCALGLWLRPEFRVPCGVVTMVAALISLPQANLGGFGVGLVSGLISASLALSWAPGTGELAAPVRVEPDTDAIPVITPQMLAAASPEPRGPVLPPAVIPPVAPAAGAVPPGPRPVPVEAPSSWPRSPERPAP